MRYRKGKPYIRRAHRKDKSESMRVAFRMAFLQITYGNYYVLVQHGFRNQVVHAERTKEDLVNSLGAVKVGRMTFKQWQRDFHRACGLGKYAGPPCITTKGD